MSARLLVLLPLALVVLSPGPGSETHAESIGDLSVDRVAPRLDPNSITDPFGAGGPFKPDGVGNPFSPYDSPFSDRSATNPFAADAPRLFDLEEMYRGRLNANPFDPESAGNPFGPYGSPLFPDSITNPFGAGNPFRPDSPNNPYGSGWRIEGRD